MKRREKMKRILLFLLVCFMASSALAASSTATASGNFNNPAIWDPCGVPPLANEVKISGADGITVTVNDNRGDYLSKLSVARDNVLDITGGYISFANDAKVGDAGASGDGTDIGYLNLKGGQLNAGKILEVGYQSGSTGYVTISGGTLTGDRIKVACEGSDGSTGWLKIEGTGGTINMSGDIYIANDSSSSSGDTGDATVEFELNSSGLVSRTVSDQVIIDAMAEELAIAKLLVTVTGSVQAADIVLMEQTATSAVVGVFDSLNGGSAAEGAYVNLGTEWFQLTYLYDAGTMTAGVGNDIALVLVPEPATLALLALGGLIVAKRRRS
jgi:hypothetical protein